MIHMVTWENRELYAAQLDEMFQLRRVHFVEERGWSGLTVKNGAERDDWDDARTIYFMALDDEGGIGVCMRARPTEDRCILADLFPQLVHPESGPVKGPGIWEISRIFATKAFRTRTGLRRRGDVFLASMEAAAAAGATRLVGIIDTVHLPQAARFPWRLRPLGLPQPYPEGEMIGVGIDVSDDELMRVREALAQEGPIIVPSLTTAQLEVAGEIIATLDGGALRADHIQVLGKILKIIVREQLRATPEQLIAILERETAIQLRGAYTN